MNNNLKVIVLGAALSLAMTSMASADQDLVHLAAKAGKATYKAAKWTVEKLDKGAVKTTILVKDGVVYAYDKTKEGADVVIDGVKYTAKKTEQGVVYVADKTKEGAVYAAEKTKEGAVYTAEKTKEGAVVVIDGVKYTAKKTEEGVVYAADKTADGVEFAADKTKEGAQAAYSDAIKPYIFAPVVEFSRLTVVDGIYEVGLKPVGKGFQAAASSDVVTGAKVYGNNVASGSDKFSTEASEDSSKAYKVAIVPIGHGFRKGGRGILRVSCETANTFRGNQKTCAKPKFTAEMEALPTTETQGE
jgi:hypothetical protein